MPGAGRNSVLTRNGSAPCIRRDYWGILACLDHVRARLGLPEFSPGSYKPPPPAPDPEPEAEDNTGANVDYARRIWHEAKPIGSTLAQYYLFAQRGLLLDRDIDWSGVLRFHPKLRLDGKNVPGMVALMRDILTNEPLAIQRTFLTKEGRKICPEDARWCERLRNQD